MTCFFCRAMRHKREAKKCCPQTKVCSMTIILRVQEEMIVIVHLFDESGFLLFQKYSSTKLSLRTTRPQILHSDDKMSYTDEIYSFAPTFSIFLTHAPEARTIASRRQPSLLVRLVHLVAPHNTGKDTNPNTWTAARPLWPSTQPPGALRLTDPQSAAPGAALSRPFAAPASATSPCPLARKSRPRRQTPTGKSWQGPLALGWQHLLAAPPSPPSPTPQTRFRAAR